MIECFIGRELFSDVPDVGTSILLAFNAAGFPVLPHPPFRITRPGVLQHRGEEDGAIHWVWYEEGEAIIGNKWPPPAEDETSRAIRALMDEALAESGLPLTEEMQWVEAPDA